jgi:glycosyltransferase involved in cell wall biosynthesis
MAAESNATRQLRLLSERDPPKPSTVRRSELDEWASSGVVVLAYRSGIILLIREADAVVLPSYREGLPKAFLGAASYGRAIISTDVADCGAIVSQGDRAVWGRNPRAGGPFASLRDSVGGCVRPDLEGILAAPLRGPAGRRARARDCPSAGPLK